MGGVNQNVVSIARLPEPPEETPKHRRGSPSRRAHTGQIILQGTPRAGRCLTTRLLFPQVCIVIRLVSCHAAPRTALLHADRVQRKE